MPIIRVEMFPIAPPTRDATSSGNLPTGLSGPVVAPATGWTSSSPRYNMRTGTSAAS